MAEKGKNEDEQGKPKVEPTTETGRRNFLGDTARAIGAAALVGEIFPAVAQAAAAAFDGKRDKLNPCGCALGSPVETKLTKLDTTPRRDGDEFYTEFVTTDSAGRSDVLRSFAKIVRSKDAYTVIHRSSPTALLPGYTAIISATKGDIDGDRRVDTVLITILFEDGTVYHHPEQQVRVRITNPYAGMTTEQMVQEFEKDKAAGKIPQ